MRRRSRPEWVARWDLVKANADSIRQAWFTTFFEDTLIVADNREVVEAGI